MDQFLDYFLPKLAKIAPEQSALFESIMAGYKICHSDKLNGITLESVEIGADRSTSSHPNSAMLLRSYPWLSSEVCRVALPPHSKEWHRNDENIVIESNSVNKRRIIAASKAQVDDIQTNIHIDVNTLTGNIFLVTNNDAQSDFAKMYLHEMETASLNDLYGTMFNVLYYAITGNVRKINPLTNKPRTTIKSSYVYVSLNDSSIMEIRLSDHSTVIAKKYTVINGKRTLKNNADRFVGINLNDEAKSELLPEIIRASTENNNALNLVEVKFHLEKIITVPSVNRISVVLAILNAIEYIVMKSTASTTAEDMRSQLSPLIEYGICEVLSNET